MDHFYQGIVGFADNCRNLYKEEVDRAQDGDIFVEVGVCLGRSLAFLAVEVINSKKNISIHGIDHWGGDRSLWWNADMVDLLGEDWAKQEGLMYNTCIKNLEPVAHVVKLLKNDSAKAASNFEDESVAFVFIDADHERDAVMRDLTAWWPKVKPGGTLGGDDYSSSWRTVIAAVDEFVEKNKLQFEELEHGTWRIRKP